MNKTLRFSLLSLLMLVCGGVFAEEVTVGRTVPFEANASEVTVTSVEDAVTTILDGTGGQKGSGGKGLFYKTTSSVSIDGSVCYRDKKTGGDNITEAADDCFAGLQIVIPAGKKMTLSSIEASVAVSVNFTYKIGVFDADGTELYMSQDKAVGNYNKTSASNVDVTITPAEAIELTGTNYVRLFYWNTGNSGSKYICPLKLNAKGDISTTEAPAEVTELLALTFPEYNDEKISSYTSEWTATVDGNVWTLNGFNNNNNGWTFVRCGRKNNAHTATITSPAVNGVAKSVVYTVDNATNIESVKFTVLNGTTEVSETDITEKFVSGDVTVDVDGVVGYSYKLTINSTSASSNGTTQISKVVINGMTAEPAEPAEECVYATFEAPTGITWDAVNKTFSWTTSWGNQLTNIGLPNGNLLPYEKLVVDCEILEGDGYRLMFYANNKGTTAGGLTIITESGKKEYLLKDFVMDADYLTNCSEICLSGYNESGKVKVNSVYLVKSNDPLVAFKEVLSNSIVKAKLYSAFGKTEESFAALTTAIANGEAALAAADATEASLTEATTAIDGAIAGLQLAEGYTALTADMFKKYTSLDNPGEGTTVATAYELFKASDLPYGDSSVGELNWADLSAYDKLVVVTSGTVKPRFCINRLVANGQQASTKEESKMLDINDNNGNSWSADAYQTISGNVYTIDLKAIVSDYGFARLHCIKKQGFGEGVFVTDMLLYKDNAAPEEGADFTDHIANANLSSTEGWTPVLSGGYRDFGNGKIGTYQVYIAPSTADATHTADEYCLGFECRWQTNYSSAYQNTAALPAGTYRLTYDVENVNSATTKANYQNLFAVTTAGKVFADQQTEWMNGKSSWTTHTIEFTVDIPGAVRISFGYGTGTNNFGSGNTPALYVSHVKLVQLEEAAATEYSIEQPSADLLVNGSFDTANQGWTLANMDYQANQERPTRYVEKWQQNALTGSGSASQTLVAMPAGAYMLKATVHTNKDEAGGAKLTLGDKVQNVSGAWKEYTIIYNNETDGADIPVSFSFNNIKSNWVAIDDASVVFIGDYAKVEKLIALQDEVAKAEAMADQDAPMVGFLNDAIAEAKTVLEGDATAEQLEAAIAALQQAEADFIEENAIQEIDYTDKVALDQNAWNGTGFYTGANVTTSLGTATGLPEFYGSSDAGVKLQQTVTGLENGTYVVKVFATSHNAWNNHGATLQEDADDVAYVFANDQKTWITARRNSGFVEGEATNYYTIEDAQVTDGTLTIGLALDKSGMTEWQTIQIYELKWVTSTKPAYQAKRAELASAITDANTNYTSLANGQEAFAEAVAAAQAVYESNKVTVAQVGEAITALRAAVKALIEANPAELADGTYYIQNNGGLYLAAGASWGTHAVVSEYGLDYNVALADGKYTLDSQVSNGGNNHFLNGVWNDGAAMGWAVYMAGDNKVVISNGTQYLAAQDNNSVELVGEITDAAKWTFVAKDDFFAALNTAFETATPENPVDATAYIQGANFGRNDLRRNAWIITRNGGNMTIAGPDANRATYGCEFWNNTFDIHQDFSGLPQGVYEFRIDGYSTNGTGYVYANETVAPFTYQTGAANFSTALDNIAQYSYNTTGQTIVYDGFLTIGVKRDVNQGGDWTVLDNARLYYLGNGVSLYEQAYDEALAAAKAVSGNMGNAEVGALAAAIDYQVDRQSREDLYNATAALKAATANALASIAAFEEVGKVFPIVDKVLANTNVYTPEAYRDFKVYYEAQRRAYKSGDMSLETAQQFKANVLGNGYKAENTIDDLLLSVWKAGETDCRNYDAPLYINTWSVEGDTDGSDFKVPFFEYFGNQANTFTATMQNVEPGIYDVTAWVRVRSTNDEPATGVTFQANDSEPVDVCDGDELYSGANHFFLKKVATKAAVAADGVLAITFAVAADNNCDWLSFRDVMFTMDVQATADAEKAAQMADAQGQVDDVKAELAEAIENAKSVYNTGDVRYPAAAALAEAIAEAQAVLDGTADITKLSQLNSTMQAVTEATDALLAASNSAENDMMVDHVIYYWNGNMTSENTVTLAEGVTMTITGNAEKKYSSASNVKVYGKDYKTVKLSNGAENTLNTTKKVKSITFYSYINKDYAEGLRDSYWKEVAGETYTAEDNGGLMSSFKDLENPDARYFEFSEPTNVVTFTNTGEQLCFVMDVEYADETVGIDELTAGRRFAGETIYNLAGQRVEQPVKGGLYIIGGRKVVVK